MSAKAVILILGVVGVVFFVTLGFGTMRNKSAPLPSKNDKNGREEFVRMHPPPEWIDSLLGSFSSKLTLPQKTFSFGSTPLNIDIPESDKRFRQATFVITEGCAEAGCENVVIRYDSQHPDARDLGLPEQKWKPGTRSPREGSLIIFRDRGPITFECNGAPRCVVELQ